MSRKKCVRLIEQIVIKCMDILPVTVVDENMRYFLIFCCHFIGQLPVAAHIVSSLLGRKR